MYAEEAGDDAECTLRFYWLRLHRNWKRLQREKRDWAGSSIVLFVRACRHGWPKKRQEATLGRAQIVISQKWRTRLQSKEFQKCGPRRKPTFDKQKEVPCVAAIPTRLAQLRAVHLLSLRLRDAKVLPGVLDAQEDPAATVGGGVMQTFPRMVLGMNKMKDRKRAVVARKAARGKEEEFAQQEADYVLKKSMRS